MINAQNRVRILREAARIMKRRSLAISHIPRDRRAAISRVAAHRAALAAAKRQAA